MDKTREQYIEYSTVLLRLWMDNYLTDGQYYKIMDKINADYKEIIQTN